jgi:hypothetical protein
MRAASGTVRQSAGTGFSAVAHAVVKSKLSEAANRIELHTKLLISNAQRIGDSIAQ